MRPNPLTETITRVRPTRYSRDEWEIVECLETGMVFLANPPEYTQLVDEFAWEKTFVEARRLRRAREPLGARVSDLLKAIRRVVRKQDRIVNEAVKLAVEIRGRSGDRKPLELLDVGCGDAGKLVEIVSALVANDFAIVPLGIEISRVQADVAQRRLSDLSGHCIHASALDGLRGLADHPVDLIVLRSFLEHEVRPLAALQECRRILRARGRIVIKVPNFGCINRHVRQRRWCGFRYPDHVNYFTPPTLRRVIEAAGLRVARMNIWDRWPTDDNMWAVAASQTDR